MFSRLLLHKQRPKQQSDVHSCNFFRAQISNNSFGTLAECGPSGLWPRVPLVTWNGLFVSRALVRRLVYRARPTTWPCYWMANGPFLPILPAPRRLTTKGCKLSLLDAEHTHSLMNGRPNRISQTRKEHFCACFVTCNCPQNSGVAVLSLSILSQCSTRRGRAGSLCVFVYCTRRLQHFASSESMCSFKIIL